MRAAVAAFAREPGTMAAARVTPIKLLAVVATMAAAEPTSVPPAALSSIEILLGDATVRVHGEADRVALRTVLDCLATRS